MTNICSLVASQVFPTLMLAVAIASLKPDKIQASYATPYYQSEEAGPTRPKIEYDFLTHQPLETKESPNIDLPKTEIFERVVLQGSRISISCPHYIAEAWKDQEALKSTIETINEDGDVDDGVKDSYNNNNVVTEKKQFASAKPVDLESPTQDELESVKWFRNHVPLLNLNYFQQHPQEQHRNKVSKITELNQTTETNNLNAASGGLHQKRRRRRQSERLSNEQLSGANLIKQHDSMEKKDVNESVEDRKPANMLNANNRQLPMKRPPEMYINSFGELVINKVSQYSAGKYTCLFAGKQSEVLLDVLVFNQEENPSERAEKIKENPVESSSRQVVPTLISPSTGAVSDELGQEEANNVELVVQSNEFSTGSDDYGTGNGTVEGDQSGRVTTVATDAQNTVHSINRADVDQATTDFLADEEKFDSRAQESNLHHNASDSSDEVYSIKSPSRGDAEQTTGKVTLSQDVLKSLDRPLMRGPKTSGPPTTGRRIKINGQNLRYSKHLMAHIVKNEAIHTNAMEPVPGFLFNKQQLHCPIAGQTGLNLEHIYPLLHSLCSIPSKLFSKSHENKKSQNECLHLALRLVVHLISKHQAKGGSRNCSASILELLWFKDGEQLVFDSNGKEAKSGSNLKLINIVDQIHLGNLNGVAEGSAAKTVTDGFLADEKLHQSDRRICSVKGRTLEINGVKKDNAGHYTCAFRLDIAKTVDIVRHLRHLNWQSTGYLEGLIALDNGPTSQDEAVGMTNQESTPMKTQESQARIKMTDLKFNPIEDNLTAKVNLFKSILWGEKPLDDKQFLNCFEQAVLRIKNTLIAIQTFSLLVSERSANSSKLWLDITEASSAYNRRKFADFRRLKRELAATRELGSSDDDIDVAKDKSLPVAAVSTIQEQMSDNWQDKAGSIGLNGVAGSLHVELDRSERSNKSIDSIEMRQMQQHDGAGIVRLSSSLSSSSMMPFDGLEATTGDGQRGYNLLLNNAAKSDSSNIGSASVSHSKLVDYANEVGPNSWRLSTVARHQNDDGQVASLMGSDEKDQLQRVSPRVKTKDSITQKGLYGADIVQQSAKRIAPLNADYVESRSGKKTLKLEALSPVFIIDDDLIDSRDLGETRSRPNDDKGTLNQPTTADYYAQKATGGRLLNAWQGDKLPPLSAQAEKGYELNSPSTQSSEMRQFLIDTPNKNTITLSSHTADNRPLLADKLLSEREDVHLGQSPRAEKQPINGLATSIPEREYHPLHSADSILSNGNKTNPPIMATSRENELDETLMWTAGQYLYMHMRAVAASSMFGVEVDVEWSNERTNSSNIGAEDKTNIDTVRSFQSRNNVIDNDEVAFPPYSDTTRDTVPFATIDVISEQNLHLQCTAQALGRLPEVKWYKRISTIPQRLRNLVKLARRIGHDLYWPLADLNLLEEDQSPSRSKSFVCSEGRTIFDNLVNQTFTVVSSIQLSQYNDKGRKQEEFEPVRSNPSPGGHYNLYACIVDADVRHNYATLGVHLRETTRKLQLEELGKRLRSREIQTKAQHQGFNSLSMDKSELVESDDFGQFDLFRDNRLQYPLRSYWIPIRNSTTIHGQLIASDFPVAPILLSMIIAFVFSSLLVLVYLTMRSYRSLTQHRSKDDIDFVDADTRLENTIERVEFSDNNRSCLNGTPKCLCHLYPSRMFDESRQMDTLHKQQQPMLYKAHSHGSECLDRPLIDIDSSNEFASKLHPVGCATDQTYHHHSILLADCYHKLATSHVNEGLKVNMFENPLENYSDQL